MNAVRPTSTAAIVSLVSGIASWVMLPFLAAIVAIVAGHMARAEIQRSGAEGDGLAIAGLILGYANLALCIAVLAVLFLGLAGLGWLMFQAQP
jgi:zinc transporter ZupT